MVIMAQNKKRALICKDVSKLSIKRVGQDAYIIRYGAVELGEYAKASEAQAHLSECTAALAADEKFYAF